jgi:hypothetical protein
MICSLRHDVAERSMSNQRQRRYYEDDATIRCSTSFSHALIHEKTLISPRCLIIKGQGKEAGRAQTQQDDVYDAGDDADDAPSKRCRLMRPLRPFTLRRDAAR